MDNLQVREVSDNADLSEQTPDKMMHLVFRAKTTEYLSDVDFCAVSIEKDAVFILLQAYEHLIGNSAVDTISIYLPFGMYAEFLGTDDELEDRFAGDANVSAGIASSFTYQIVPQPLDEEKVKRLQSSWMLYQLKVEIDRQGNFSIFAGSLEDYERAETPKIPLKVITDFFGLLMDASNQSKIFFAYFDKNCSTRLRTIIISAPDEKQAKYLAVLEKINFDQSFTMDELKKAELANQAAIGMPVRCGSVVMKSPDFDEQFRYLQVKELISTKPYELIYTDFH